jgi:tetratricopeptide (TPR) repeat protein
LGDLNGAEATERKVLTIRQRVSGLDHPHTTFSLNMLGWILLEKGEWSDAEPYLKQAYDANRKRLGQRHPRLAVSLNNLGQVYEEKGDYRAAEKYYRDSLSILEENKLAEGWNAAKVEDNLALLAMDRGDYPAAERLAQQALNIQHKLGGDSNPDDALSLICLGLAKSLRHDSAGAEPLLRRALAIRQMSFPPGHLLIIAAQIRLGEVLIDEGRTGEAETLLRGASTSAHHSPFPLPPWQVAEADNALGACLAHMERRSEAFLLLRSSRTALKAHPQATIRKRDLARTLAVLQGPPRD